MSTTTAVIGSVPARRDFAQSKRGDFAWTLTLLDGDEATDLEDSEFEFVIYSADGTAALTKTVGSGITIDDNTVTIAIDKTEFEDLTAGCSYKYHLDWTNAEGFTKPLFEGKITLV